MISKNMCMTSMYYTYIYIYVDCYAQLRFSLHLYIPISTSTSTAAAISYLYPRRLLSHPDLSALQQQMFAQPLTGPAILAVSKSVQVLFVV